MSASAPGLSTFGEDAAGELYAATENGSLYRIVTPEEAIPFERTVATPESSPTFYTSPREVHPH